MSKFKVGDKVRIVQEPFFFTNHNNGIWKMHPDPKQGKPCDPDSFDLDCRDGVYEPFFGRADLTHLIGVEGTIKEAYEYPILGEKHSGIWKYRLDIPEGVPRGMDDFEDEHLELI